MEIVLVVAQITLAKTSSRWVHSQTQIGGKIRSIFPGTVGNIASRERGRS